MRLTSGFYSLKTPKETGIFFEFKDIIVSTSGKYDFGTTLTVAPIGDNDPFSYIDTSYILISLQSGRITNTNGYPIGTYTTGVPFDFSGLLTTSSQGTWYYLDNALMRTMLNQSGAIYELYITVPASGTLDCSVQLKSQPITYTLTIPEYGEDQTVTGKLTASTWVETYGSSFQFYKSYEQLLTGDVMSGHLYADTPYSLVWKDNDSSNQSNTVEGVFHLNTLGGDVPLYFYTVRSRDTSFMSHQLDSYNSGVSFGNYFDGYWSGQRFYYQDSPSSTIFYYNYSAQDTYGSPSAKSIRITGTVGNATAYYVTGFTLTASGEYLQVPKAEFTGYYFVTGMQNPLSSFLFSSGCTGDLDVTFTARGGFGANASGKLVTYPLILSGVYLAGFNTYYLVSSYQALNSGTGYTMAPIAVVNTGKYGSSCYDVPAVYGNQAWYLPSTGSYGALLAKADYMTGYPLYVTGIVGAGQTGYKVTGIEMTNIGSGYDTLYIPRMKFTRQVGDGLTSNASGTFMVKAAATIGTQQYFSGDISVGNQTFSGINLFTGTIIQMGATDTSFRIKVTMTGLDNTAPMTGSLIISGVGGSVNTTDTFTIQRQFYTDTGALKKNNSVNYYFEPPIELSFMLTEDELDEFYSSPEFTNNGEIDLGDLDF